VRKLSSIFIESFHNPFCFIFWICPTSLAYPIEFYDVNPPLAQLALRDKGVLFAEPAAKFSLRKPSLFPNFLYRILEDFGLLAMDSSLHVPIIGSCADCPQNRDTLEWLL